MENLLYVLRLRVLAARGGLKSISLEGRRVAIRPNGDSRAAWDRLPPGLVQMGREKVHLRVDARTPGGRQELLELLARAVGAEG